MKKKTEYNAGLPFADPEFSQWERKFLDWSRDTAEETPDWASIRRRQQLQLRFRRQLYGIAAALLLGCGVLFTLPQLRSGNMEKETPITSEPATTAVAATELTERIELSWDVEVDRIASLQPEMEALGENFRWQLAAFDPIQMEETKW